MTLQRIRLAQAASRQWDVVLAGTSFSAMFLAQGLPPDLSVLFVEKGPWQTHSEQIARDEFAGSENFRKENHSEHRKVWVAHTQMGGNSNCWWACTPRFHPSDFRLNSLYGQGRDWPVNYGTLEPFYCEVEEIMEVAGGGSDRLLPRSRPFPYPPHALSRTDRKLVEHLPGLWHAQPAARSNGGSRIPRCATGTCGLCPIDAKFTVLNALERLIRPNFHLLLEAEARAAVIEGGAATALLVRSQIGEAEIRGDVIGLCANAIHNAAILLRSGLTAQPLGRYLHEQASRPVSVEIDHPNYFGGTSITGHGYPFYEGAHRREVAAVLVENINAPFRLRHEPRRWTEIMSLKLLAEDIPQARNRVMLEDDEPRIDWYGHSEYALAGIDRAVRALPDILPFNVEALHEGSLSVSESHITGTHRMGKSVEDGVVDDRFRCFEASGLYAIGAGAFPTCSPANPTLTLSALALRAGRML